LALGANGGAGRYAPAGSLRWRSHPATAHCHPATARKVRHSQRKVLDAAVNNRAEAERLRRAPSRVLLSEEAARHLS